MSKWIVMGGSGALILAGAGLIVSSAAWRAPDPGGRADLAKTPAASPSERTDGGAVAKAGPMTCEQCELKECPERRAYCEGFEGSKRDACNALVECVRKSSCHSRLTVDCYCGTADATECATEGGANGACKKEIEVGLGTTTPRPILSKLLDPAAPGGAAMALMYCDSEACKASCVAKRR